MSVLTGHEEMVDSVHRAHDWPLQSTRGQRQNMEGFQGLSHRTFHVLWDLLIGKRSFPLTGVTL